MKTTLTLSTVAAWLALAFYYTSIRAKPLMGIDAILPSSLIRQSTPEERQQVSDNIAKFNAPSTIQIGMLGFVCVANTALVYISSRKKNEK